jgi:MFS family permease
VNRPVVTQQPTQAAHGLGRLLGATGVSMIGQGVVIAAVPLLAASLTRSPFSIALVSAATYAAWLVIGLPAGALVDRWPRRMTMVIADAARAALLVGLALAVRLDQISVPALIAVVFLIACAGCFFDPAAQAAIPMLTGRDSSALAKANGRLWTLDILGRSLFGPPLGAALFALSASLPFGLNAVTFLASAALLIGLRSLGRPLHVEPHGSVASSVKDGITFLVRHPQLRLLVAGMGAYNLGYNIGFATLVLFAQDRLGLSARGFGLLLATLAIGGAAGGWLAPMVHTRVTPAMTYAACLAIQAAVWCVLALVENPWSSAGALALLGLASTVVSVVGGTARQALTPDHLMGRITAGSRVVGIGAAAVGSLIGGVLASIGTLATPFVVAAILLALSSLVFALRRHSAS